MPTHAMPTHAHASFGHPNNLSFLILCLLFGSEIGGGCSAAKESGTYDLPPRHLHKKREGRSKKKGAFVDRPSFGSFGSSNMKRTLAESFFE